MIPYDKLILLGIITWQEYRVLKMNSVIEKQAEAVTSANEQMSYLVSILNKHQISLDEFDYIALPNVKPKRVGNTD
jgi:hypothetical protein